MGLTSTLYKLARLSADAPPTTSCHETQTAKGGIGRGETPDLRVISRLLSRSPLYSPRCMFRKKCIVLYWKFR